MQTCANGCNTPLASRQLPIAASRRTRTRRCSGLLPSPILPWHAGCTAYSGAQQRCHQPRKLAPPGAWGAAAPTAPPEATLRGLYPASKVHDSGMLQVSDLHSIYYEVHGNPNGVPALFLHGGPGAGCFANHARFFDPSHYKIVLLDQRGCGRSQPRGCLQDNHTTALVSDCEQLRRHLGIEQWGVALGGSWGVALALAYAQAHPDRIASMVLRGICLMRPQELAWMYGGGAAALKPRAWEAFLSHLEAWQRGNPLLGYYGKLLSPDASVRDAAAQAWMSWEMAVGFGSKGQPLMWNGSEWRSAADAPQLPPKPRPMTHAAPIMQQPPHTPTVEHRGAATRSISAGSRTPTTPPGFSEPPPWVWGLPGEGANAERPEVQQLLLRGLSDCGGPGAAVQALLECHYSLHGGFLLDAPLLQHMDSVRHIPCIAVHGQLDFVCPPATAYALHSAWPEMELHMVPGAGHSMYEPAITHELVQATDRMRAVQVISQSSLAFSWALPAAAGAASAAIKPPGNGGSRSENGKQQRRGSRRAFS